MSKLRVNSQGQRSKVVSQRSEVKSQRWMVKSRSWKYHRVLLANSSKHSTDTTSYWTLMTSAQEIETSAIATDNSSLKESFCPDDQRSRLTISPGFKPFTVLTLELISNWKRVAPSRSAFWLSAKGAFQACVPPYKHFALLRVMMRFFAPDKGIFTFQIGTILTLYLI